jgi:trimethylamine--corrinoid protein Co-methyltransferase
VIREVGPGGHFLAERSTVDRLRGGDWYISKVGVHEPYDSWVAKGQPRLLEGVRLQVDEILARHEPLSLDEDIEQELERIQARARQS